MGCYINPRLGFDAWSNYSETNQLFLLNLPAVPEKSRSLKMRISFVFLSEQPVHES